MAKPKAGVVVGASVLAMIGVVFFVVAAFSSGGEVTCDGKTMRPSDVCLEVAKDGRKTYHNFAELKAEQDARRPVLLGALGGIGGLFVLAAGGFLVAGSRENKKDQAQIEAAAAWMRAG
ncbi:hypothetical protein [Catellatospora sichuanensis]|uniref:hypothetical protein n=1 Tax=Catellatospora sichuanensis TaxID=1969805 RepID=UPI0011835274|nr:hypothetical protein [Catellatospora sichuanensis]